MRVRNCLCLSLPTAGLFLCKVSLSPRQTLSCHPSPPPPKKNIQSAGKRPQGSFFLQRVDATLTEWRRWQGRERGRRAARDRPRGRRGPRRAPRKTRSRRRSLSLKACNAWRKKKVWIHWFSLRVPLQVAASAIFLKFLKFEMPFHESSKLEASASGDRTFALGR